MESIDKIGSIFQMVLAIPTYNSAGCPEKYDSPYIQPKRDQDQDTDWRTGYPEVHSNLIRHA